MGQCFRQAYNFLLVFPQLDIMYCNYIASALIMCCREVCDLLVMSFLTITSLHMDLLIHIFLGGMQMFCGLSCNCAVQRSAATW